MQRRMYLRRSKCFDCMCQRCRDPTECATFIGSLICTRCKSDKLLPDKPLDATSDWYCGKCSFQVTATNFQFIQNRLQFAIENLPKQSPYDFETFLEKYCYRARQHSPSSDDIEEDLSAEILLHENNTFALQVKYALTQLYGNVDGFRWNGMLNDTNSDARIHFQSKLFLPTEIGDTDLSRKISLCNELLKVAQVLEPGESVFRGKLLVDLQEALFVQTERQLSGRDISAVVAKVS